ncbi:MAG: BcpO-related WXXGXW repeat protein [Kofleriaceae bacterium]|nr:BcpO-related WXXGXW repeat protein [Kofleriaceae bacterium]
MRRTFGIATILCMLLGSAAYADHGRGRGRGHGDRSGGVVVRDHRGPDRRGPAVRDHRHGGARVGHVRVSNGRYVFPGGVVRVYRRPVIRQRYYNVHVRPQVIVEHYDPVPGYMWVSGSWSWGGREWIWQPGYWAAAEAPPPPPQPVIRGGISVSGGISIH